MTNCGYLLFIVALAAAVTAVKIDNIKVPSEYILDNFENPKILVLDCEYDLPVDEHPFVLKWFFNDHLIYQWVQIRNSSRFFWSTLIRNNVDRNYTASPLSALAITKPSPNMTGTYTCTVYTFQSEDKRSKHMQIIIPESDFQLKVGEATDGSEDINVECSAQDVYPEPKMVISFSNTNQTSNGFVSETKRDDKNELWDITIYGTIKQSEQPFDIHCILFLPNTSYAKQKDVYAFTTLSFNLSTALTEASIASSTTE